MFKDFFRRIDDKQWYRRIAYFFPVQLFILHLKRNHILLFFWVLLFGYVNQNLAVKYGIPSLFLEPEYLGNVNIWSHFILGMCMGLFIMAFNMSSYIINGTSFPFIVTLARPILKYCINNFIILFLFFGVYIYNFITFQYIESQETILNVLLHLFAFFWGVSFFILITFLYFFSTTKNIFKMFSIKDDEHGNPVFIDKFEKRKKLKIRRWTIETYLSGFFSIRLVRSANHYTSTMIESVFKQNHSNAAFFQLVIVIILLTLGLFRDNPYFIIPAGGSILLVSSFFLMITSGIHYWLRGWGTSVLIFFFVILNYSNSIGYLASLNKAYGLKYNAKIKYTDKALRASANEAQSDYILGLQILNKWKEKTFIDNLQKPKLVIINASGGGLRSAVWTFYSLQKVDSMLGGKILTNAHLMTGSSGGMLGLSYIRELYLRKQQGEINNLYSNTYVNNISNDILNPVAYSIAVNDLFISLQNFELNGEVYQKDRAYAFEYVFNKNTHGILNKSIADYADNESNAIIPLMFITTVNVNDGKRLIISPQKLAYINNKMPINNTFNNTLPDEVEFSKLFNKLGAKNLRFTSALRMNATFPYVLPAVSLPCEPEATVMDAGGRDNFGLELSLKYLYVYKDWIAENTSGIVIIQTRDKVKRFEAVVKENSIANKFIRPLGSLYENLSRINDYNQDQLIQYASTWYNGPIDVVHLSLQNKDKNKVSLSWHLTKREKTSIINSLDSEVNKENIEKLKVLLK